MQAAGDHLPTWPLGEAIYRQFLGGFIDAMYLHDDQGRLLDFNQAGCDTLGYTREELLGMPTTQFSSQYSEEDLLNIWRNHPAGHNNVETNVHQRKDGSTFHVEVHVACQEFEGRKYFLALVRDVEEKYQRDLEIQRLNQQLEAAVLERTRQWKESARLLDAVMQQTPDAVFVKDIDGHYRYANQGLASNLQRSVDDILGRRDEDLYSPEDLLICQRTDRETLRKDQACLFEERMRVDGEIRVVNVMKAPYRDEHGQVIGLLGISRNITDMRQAQEQMAHNYEMLRQAERIAKVGSWSLDLATNTFSASEMLTEMNGLGPDDPPLTPEGLQRMIPAQEHATLSEAIQNCAVHGIPYAVDVQHRRPSGGFFPARIRGQAYRNAQGAIVLLHGTLQDLSEHVEAQERLQRLADNLPNGAIFRCEQEDRRLHLRYVSAGIQGLLGFSANTLMAQQHGFFSAIYSEDRPGFMAQIQACLAEDAPFEAVCRMLHADGRLRWMRTRAAPRTTHQAKLWEGILLDVTSEYEAQQSLQRAKEAAEAAERAKSEFLATMSHEIRTPMNAVIGMTQLLQQTQVSPKQRNYLDKVALSANALLAIINDILDFSKLEADMLELDPVPFSPDELLETVSTVTSLRAEQKGIEIVYAVDASVPRQLHGDVQRLAQILTNLVSNAIKFTERGEVVVSLKAEPDRRPQHTDGFVLHVVVRDTGIGIHPEHQAQLFQPFMQAEAHISRRFGGTGLGLAISNRLVQMMGGNIQVSSQLGLGSEFRFHVPLRAPNHLPSTKALALHDCRVLVVDDNPMAREILSHMVVSFGLECRSASGGREALTLLQMASDQGAPYQLVLMDWRMPGMDGLQVAERIRSHDSLSDTPAMLMVTAYCRDEVLERVAELGLQGLLVKPVTESALFNAIQDALQQHRGGGLLVRGASTDTSLQVPANLQGCRVLVVDDNALNREVAQDFLELAGVLVTTANSGRDALALIDAHSFDAVLLDVQMPEMDGLEVARRIRSQARFEQLPLLALTAQARLEDREAILASGMDSHLSKPIDVQVLFNALSQAIAKGAAQTDAQAPSAPAPAEPALTRHFVGQQDRQQRLLRAFLRDFAPAPQQMLELHRQQDWNGLGMLAHSLKGALGYLNQMPTMATMDSLEWVCRNSAPSLTQTELAVEQLRQVLQQVETGLEASPAPEAQQQPAVGIDTAPLRGWLLQAMPHIRSGDYAGVQLLERLESALRGSPLHGLAARGLSLAEDLENQAACETLEQLLAALQAPE